LGKFWEVEWKMFVYFTVISNILQSLHRYILWPFSNVDVCNLLFIPRFGILYQEKSGNPYAKNRKKPCRASISNPPNERPSQIIGN
jgi:hypothetical protein